MSGARPFSFEVSAVNDGSTDRVTVVVEKVAHDHDHPRLINQQPNRGNSVAVPHGMLAAAVLVLAGIQFSLTLYGGWLAADLNQTTRPDAAPAEALTLGVVCQVISVAFAGPFLLGNVIPLVAKPVTWIVTPVFLDLLVMVAP